MPHKHSANPTFCNSNFIYPREHVPLESVYSIFSESRVGTATSRAVAVASSAIGVPAITRAFPRTGSVSATFLAGGGGFFFILTAALASRCNWREQLRSISGTAPTPEVSPQESLNTLCLLIKDAMSPLFKNPIPDQEPTSPQMQALFRNGQKKKGEKLYWLVAKTFRSQLPSLKAFIRSQTHEILLNSPTEARCDTFKLVNKQIRMILLFLLSHEKKNYLTEYQNHVDHYYGNRRWNVRDCNQPICYFKRLFYSLNGEQREEIADFIILFSTYRRHSLHRLFSQKIEQHYTNPSKDVETLLRATWFHGTRALTSLKEMNFTLIPTGQLDKMDCVPFFGEVTGGCHLQGVNMDSLSGTALDHVDWSMGKYASGFQFSIENEIKKVTQFREIEINNDIYNALHSLKHLSEALPRIEVALKRWARWDQMTFKNELPCIRKKLESLIEWAKLIKDLNPKEIFNSHDTSYSSDYESINYSLNQIEAFINSPLPQPLTQEKKTNIEINFPAVLGSLTLLSEQVFIDDLSGEHLVNGKAVVGHDLQLLCVEETNLTTAKEWVDLYQPSSNIQIFSFAQLKKAQIANKEISPYLADILSLKKFKKLESVRQDILKQSTSLSSLWLGCQNLVSKLRSPSE